MKIIGKEVLRKSVCENSSMDWAKSCFGDVSDGTVFIADKYSIARGRQGRVWAVYPGQLNLTFVLKPDISHDLDRSLRYLNMALTLGISDSLNPLGVVLKWPNDFMLVRDEKKLKVGGMLVESVWDGDRLGGLIVGISVNCNNKFSQDDELFDIATNLGEVNIESLQKELLISLNRWYERWLKNDFSEIFSAWKSRLSCLGKNLSVHAKDGSVITGTARDVSELGDLILVGLDGQEVVIPFCVVEKTVV